MNRPLATIALALALVTLSGCYISVRDDGPDGWADEDDWQRRQQRNAELIGYLELYRSLDSVTAELGAPDLTESFLRGGREFRVLRYRTRLVHEDGRTTADETTPLVFVDGELVGWGESAVAHAMP